MHRSTRALLTFALLLLLPALASAQYTLVEHDGGVRVLQDNSIVADYLTLSKSKPIVWPLIGPGGARMTRDYPMVPDSKGEAHDHPHHRSLWFTHGDVNGTDFWLEGEKGGITEHQEFTELSGGEQAVVASRNIWKTPAGEPVLTDHRRLTFGNDKSVAWLDCEFELAATHGDVQFGDTKEGTFGMRIAESMKVDAKNGGEIVNSNGQTNREAWGVAANWVDYHGPIGDKQMGIAILCHPSSFHHPNRWHVRTYGLFAANPFGVHHFLGQKEPTAGVKLSDGESMVLRYRVILHAGDHRDAKIGELYADYAQLSFEAISSDK